MNRRGTQVRAVRAAIRRGPHGNAEPATPEGSVRSAPETPFTLAAVPGYPARLEVEYPGRLHRGLVLVKWLLAIPNLLIVAILFSGGVWLSWSAGSDVWSFCGGGVVGVLVLAAAIMLAVTGQYPQPLFDIIVGLNRWGLRVAAYTALMTDRYPPFRLDVGSDDPGVSTAVSGEPDVRTVTSGG
jgi:hypothetical protein